jgi:hypothetical protein
MYRNLNQEKTIETINKLQQRIQERFPRSGLSKVCEELYTVAKDIRRQAEWIARPHYGLRAASVLLILIVLFGVGYSISLLKPSVTGISVSDLVQTSEAGLNDLVLLGAAVFFLVTIEIRLKRAKALKALHELRSLAHVIDMHQLTKDPSQYGQGVVLTATSPKVRMTSYELIRYLDYCSEMLSLIGKMAALYAQDFHDSVVLSAVNELENLTTGLSRKIWQKIIILNKLEILPQGGISA